MNGAQQVERFTAVRRAEKRLDDIEILLPALAQEMVADREAAATANLLRMREIDSCETALQNEERIRENLRRSFWQRLRWMAGV